MKSGVTLNWTVVVDFVTDSLNRSTWSKAPIELTRTPETICDNCALDRSNVVDRIMAAHYPKLSGRL